MTTRPRLNNAEAVAALLGQPLEPNQVDHVLQADLWALWNRGGDLYALAGHTVTIADDETVVATFADLAEFEAAVEPDGSGDVCRLAGYPFPAAVAKLQAVALYDGSLEWAVL